MKRYLIILAVLGIALTANGQGSRIDPYIHSMWRDVIKDPNAHIQAKTDATDFFQIKQADGTVFFNGDSTNGRVGIGTGASITGKFQVQDLIKFDDTNYNVLLGTRTFNTSNGQYNLGLGWRAGYRNSITGSALYGRYNVYIGAGAGYGATAGQLNNGYNNIAIGFNSLNLNTLGYANTAIGTYGMSKNTIGSACTSVGYLAAAENTEGTHLVALGVKAGKNNTIGHHNVTIGYYSSYNNVEGSYNTSIGNYSDGGIGPEVPNNHSAQTCVGTYSGANITTGSYGVYLGYKAGYNQTTNSSLLIIDNLDRGSIAAELTDCLIYGVFDADPANQTLRFNAAVSAQSLSADDGVSGTLELDDGSTEKITLVFTGGILTSRTVAATTGSALADWTD